MSMLWDGAKRVLAARDGPLGPRVALVAAGYLGLALVGGQWALLPGYASPVWPAAGLALVALILWGARVWPGIWLGGLLFGLWTTWSSTGEISWAGAVLLATAALLQSLLGMWLTRRLVAGSLPLVREGDIIGFLLLGGPVACLVSATIAVPVFSVLGHLPAEDIALHWLAWWAGDSLGVLLVAPLVVVVLHSAIDSRPWRAAQVGIPLLVAGALVVAAHVFHARADEASARAHASEQAAILMLHVKDKLEVALESLQSVGRFFAASDTVSRREFEQFAPTAVGRSGVQAIAWLPRVAHVDRAAWEAAVRSEGFADFSVTELAADGKLVPAAGRSEYFPVLLAAPLDRNRKVLGFDLASEDMRRMTLQRARDTGAAVASPPLDTLLSGSGVRRGTVLLFVPVYDQGYNVHDARAESRRAALRGFALGVLEVDAMFSALDAAARAHRLHVGLSDLTNGDAMQWLAGPMPALAKEAFSLTQDIDFAGRTWRIVLWSAQPLGSQGTGLLLVLSVLSAFFLGLAVLAATGRQAATAADVAHRTAALRASEAYNRSIVSSSRDCITTLSREGLLLDMNEAGRALMGVQDIATRLNTDWTSYWCDEYREAARQAVAAARAGDTGRFQALCAGVQGTPKWWDVIVSPILAANGAPERLLAVARDISGQKAAEAHVRKLNEELEQRVEERTSALQESERFSRATLDALGAHLAVLDANGVILATNDAWRAFAVSSACDWQSVSDGTDYLGVCDRSADAGDADAARAAAGIRDVIAGKVDSWVHEYPCHSPSQERWFFCRVKRFAGDGPVRVVVAHEDISAMKRAQRRFQDLFEFAQDAIVLLDPEGNVVQVNRRMEAMFGWPSGQLIGRPAEQLFSAGSEPHVDHAFRRLVQSSGEGKTGTAMRLEGRRKDGSSFPADVSLSTMAAEGSALVAVIVRDVSERVRQEEDRRARAVAEEANAAKSAFLAAMSHEIRTPMNGVVGMTEVLAHSGLAADQVDLVATIQDSARLLLRVIDDILDFSKIEAGRLELERAPVNVADLVEGVSRSLVTVATNKEVALRLFVAPDTPARVWADETRLRQIIYNLLGNAIKFSAGRHERPGRVAIRASVAQLQPFVLAVSVADNGIGIDPRVMKTLFSPFTQADATTTRRYGGSGLGLAICKRLVDLMHGEISVTSVPGEGSTFIVKLPFDVPAEQPAGAFPDLAGVTCVVTEGDMFSAADVQIYLEYAGAHVERVADVEAALQVIARLATPVVVIHDGGTGPFPAATPEIRHIVFERGRRQWARVQSPDTVVLDADALLRASLLRAVEVVVGRALPEFIHDSGERTVVGQHFSAPDIAAAREEGRLILVAEDDAVNQKVILRQLALLGYAAEVAGDGAEALRLWRCGNYALLLADLHMPRMDGYSLAEAIRAHEAPQTGQGQRQPGMPILALTANALRGEEVRARASGMQEYLTKPVELHVLQAALDRWLPSQGRASRRNALDSVVASRQAEPLVDVSVLERLLGNDVQAVRELLGDFLDAGSKLDAELTAAVAKGDASQVAAVAHKLKSASRSVGALALGDQCAELENAGKIADTAAITRWFKAVQKALSDASAEISAMVHDTSRSDQRS